MFRDTLRPSSLEEVIEQVMRRSVVDQELRELALKSPIEAIARFNPRLSLDTRVRFVDTEHGELEKDAGAETYVLPESVWADMQLSDVELEEFIGAQCDCTNCNGSCGCGDTCGSTCSALCTGCCITC